MKEGRKERKELGSRSFILQVKTTTVYPDTRMWNELQLLVEACQGHCAEEHMGWQILSRLP